MPPAGPASLPPLSPHLQQANGYGPLSGAAAAGSGQYGGSWPAAAPSGRSDRHSSATSTLNYPPNMAADRPAGYCEWQADARRYIGHLSTCQMAFVAEASLNPNHHPSFDILLLLASPCQVILSRHFCKFYINPSQTR